MREKSLCYCGGQGGIWGFGIYDNGHAARIEAAKKFIRFMADSEHTYDAVRASNFFAARSAVAAKVEVSEMMGSSVHLHVNADGHDVIIIVPTVDMKGNYDMGDTVHFSFKGNVAHVFSKATEKNLEF